MNKRGNLFLVIIISTMIIFSVLLIGLVYSDIQSNNTLKNFCNSNGYEYHEKAATRWDQTMCIKVEDNTRIESNVGRCGDRWCFVKQEKAE